MFCTRIRKERYTNKYNANNFEKILTCHEVRSFLHLFFIPNFRATNSQGFISFQILFIDRKTTSIFLRYLHGGLL